jgi:hypothetical protein
MFREGAPGAGLSAGNAAKDGRVACGGFLGGVWGEKEKWRLPDKRPFPVECQRDAFSSENPEKHEQGRNKPHCCKTEIVTSADLPVGGTTGLSHQSSVSIEQAAAWYRDHRYTAERPLIPALRRRFGLTAHEAVMALREAKGAGR